MSSEDKTAITELSRRYAYGKMGVEEFIANMDRQISMREKEGA